MVSAIYTSHVFGKLCADSIKIITANKNKNCYNLYLQVRFLVNAKKEISKVKLRFRFRPKCDGSTFISIFLNTILNKILEFLLVTVNNISN